MQSMRSTKDAAVYLVDGFLTVAVVFDLDLSEPNSFLPVIGSLGFANTSASIGSTELSGT